jgi:xanthine dehydrogenase accessory factor
MNELTESTIESWRADGAEIAVAQVVRTYRSAPRPVGSIFAVSSTGKMAGSVSGGCVEGAIYAEAQELFAGGDGPRLLHYGISDELAGDVGLACGGELWVSLDRFAERPPLRRGAIVSAVAGRARGGRLWLDADSGRFDGDLDPDLRPAAEAAALEAAADERSQTVDLPDGTVLFAEAVAPPHRLVIVGAVDTAEAVSRLAATLGWRTVVIDPRRKFATRERLPSAGEIIGEWPQEAYAAIGLEPADSVIVLTHDPKVDDPAIAGALRRGVGYVGALGSRRTQALRRERLIEEEGLPAADVERVYGPVGLDIGAHSPAETAISIVGEVIAHRSGRSGRRLVATSGRIHPTDEPA